VHKKACETSKELSNELQTYDEVNKVIKMYDEVKGAGNIRVLKHVLAYTEFQFGERIPRKSYREHLNGDQLNNFKVEIDCLLPTIFGITGFYSNEPLDLKNSLINKDNMLSPYV
jgi:hypothetical protein